MPISRSQSIQNGQLQYSVQHSLISLLIKMISSPGSYKITIKDLQIDPVVETMRSTASHHILRDSLKLLTAAVQLNPVSYSSCFATKESAVSKFSVNLSDCFVVDCLCQLQFDTTKMQCQLTSLVHLLSTLFQLVSVNSFVSVPIVSPRNS